MKMIRKAIDFFDVFKAVKLSVEFCFKIRCRLCGGTGYVAHTAWKKYFEYEKANNIKSWQVTESDLISFFQKLGYDVNDVFDLPSEEDECPRCEELGVEKIVVKIL